ncbi:hypothetical protein TR13x_10450 [Caloranaerobacter sp. TR13]|nr:hypothetical protein TR13x_10450 [Caloranaerobacter sp. TR13]
MDVWIALIIFLLIYSIIKKDIFLTILALFVTLPYFLLFKLDIFQMKLIYKIIFWIAISVGSIFLYFKFYFKFSK